MNRRRSSALVAVGLLIWATWRRPDVAQAVVVLSVPFTLLERWRPLHRRPPAVLRVGAGTDAVSFVVTEVLAGVITVAALIVAAPVLDRLMPAVIHTRLVAQPDWLRWMEAFIVSEVGGYWGHRLCHEVPLLWRFHRVHHSPRELDWLAPARRHPLDASVARLSTALPMLVLGFPVPVVATVFILKRIRGLIVHANIDLRWRMIERIYVTPFFHHWHHSDEPGTWNKNYAVSLPVMDRLFGTLHLPDRWPARYGCDGTVPTRGYIGQLRSPWSNGTTRARAPSSVDSTWSAARATSPAVDTA